MHAQVTGPAGRTNSPAGSCGEPARGRLPGRVFSTLLVFVLLAAAAAAEEPGAGASAPGDTSAARTSQPGLHETGEASDGGSLAVVWTPVLAANSPPPRTEHTAVFDAARRRMIIFGGVAYSPAHGMDLTRNDVWFLPLDGEPVWTEIVPLGPAPPARAQHAAIYDPVGDRMIVFGGWIEGPSRGPFVDDLWALSLSDPPTWTRLLPDGPRPGPRSAASASYDPLRHRMVLAGGRWTMPSYQWCAASRLPGFPPRHEDLAVPDSWALQLAPTPEWSLVHSSTASQGHAAIHDPLGDRIVAYGGWIADPCYCYCEYECWLACPGRPMATRELQLGEPSAWNEVATQGLAPAPVVAAPAVYEHAREALVLVHGHYQSRMRAWVLSLRDHIWALADSTVGGPAPGRGHSAIHDPVRGETWLYGGNLPHGGAPTPLWRMQLAASIPDIELGQLVVDFGPLVIGARREIGVRVHNRGPGPLLVSAIAADDPAFRPNLSNFRVIGGAFRDVLLSFQPDRRGPIEGILTIRSNDPDETELVIRLRGVGLLPPDISVSSTGLALEMVAGERTARSLPIRNEGDLPLDYSLTTSPGDASVLIVQDAPLTTGRWSTQEVLQGSGVRFHSIASGELATTELLHYRKIILPSAQPPNYYVRVVARAVALADFVARGGALEFHAGGVEQAGGGPSLVVLPGGMRSQPGNSTTHSVLAPAHPLVAGVPDPFWTTALGYFVDLPPNGVALVANELGRPTLVVYSLGRGLVMASAHMLEAGYELGWESRALLANLVPFGFRPLREWFRAEPVSGRIEPAGTGELLLHIESDGLEGGDYAAGLLIHSNDPDEAVVAIPVRLRVWDFAAELRLEPETLNLGRRGRWLIARVEFPSGRAIADVVPATLRLEGIAPEPGFLEIGDEDGDGAPELAVRFDLERLRPILGPGEHVTLTLTGETTQRALFRGRDVVRVLRHRVVSPNGGDVLAAGGLFDIRWSVPSNWSVEHADLHQSLDDGQSWTLVASSLRGTTYSWRVPEVDADRVLIRVDLFDGLGVLASDISDGTFQIVRGIVGVGDASLAPGLRQNTPNPFDGAGGTSIAFAIAEPAEARLEIYDLAGHRIRVLTEGRMPAGVHRIHWDGRDGGGRPLPAGLYFYRLWAGGRVETRRLTLLR